ncbi:MAG TPA: hypothetical protein VI299_05270 [Polyangiales bacterium]
MDAKASVTRAAIEPSCFLTTATVHALGLADDCEPLTLARMLRDEQMTSDRDRAAVDLYYKVAPAIVARSSEHEWLAFWEEHMREITALLRAGEYELAKDLYTLATAKLVKEKALRYQDKELADQVYAFGLRNFGKSALPFPLRYGVLKLALSSWLPLETLRLKIAKRRVARVTAL